MNKTAIKNFAIWARRKLISDITYKAGMLGVSENGVAQPLPQSTRDLQFFDIGTKDYAEVSGTAIEQRNALIKTIRAKEQGSDYKTAFRTVVEEVAYTWFNRLIAVRFMEVNDYLPSHVRVLSSENTGKLEPDFVTNPFDTDLDFSPYEKDLVYQLKDENKLDELFRVLFIKQCNKLSEILPGLFEQISDYTELLLNISFTDKDGIVYHLTHDISEDEFNVEKEGQVEIIGWMYQYYNTEPKDEVFALLKKNVKITKERIPAATQLFTPDWIVRYMVENSLGRLWVEGHPNENLKENWKYYLEEAEQEPDVVAQLKKIRDEYAKLDPIDIKVIDPCMGSGHILVYAFDVLMQIYTSQGYVERDAAKSILINNLYGIDIDVRAYQLAYFAVMMKARQYNRRIFQESIVPNLIVIQNPADVSKTVLKRLGGLETVGLRLMEDFEDAEEYGSILQVRYAEAELERVEKKLEEIEQEAQYGNLLVQMETAECIKLIKPLVKQARLLGQKYEVVVTNPPYMNPSNGGVKLQNYVAKHFPSSKTDLFAVFIENCNRMLSHNGYQAMITMHAWMFIASFEKLRISLLQNQIINMIHLGARAFEEISGEVVQTVSFVFSNREIRNYIGSYVRLLDFTTQQEKEVEFLKGSNRYYSSCDIYKSIPGVPIAYWISKRFHALLAGKHINEQVQACIGMRTGDNERFLRLWHEISLQKMKVDAYCVDQTIGFKWIPYNKGGVYRKWYGNLEYVVNWESNGYEIKENTRLVYPQLGDNLGWKISNENRYFQEYITWTDLATRGLSFRDVLPGTIFDASANAAFSKSEDYYGLLAFLNTCIVDRLAQIINPTMHFKLGNFECLPRLISNDEASNIARENVTLSKQDWDSFETSWNFKHHPLVENRRNYHDQYTLNCGFDARRKSVSLISKLYERWKNECEYRFQQLKSNEEELNKIFINIYGLQDELTPDVSDKDVTVRKADLGREIRSLISYAVGCMFGRYSLYKEGLVFAGGKIEDHFSYYGGSWDDAGNMTWDQLGKHTWGEAGKKFYYLPQDGKTPLDCWKVDADNCIPITDEEYFQDDIVGYIVEFVREAYGADYLEENLDFIAKSLGNKGNTSREVIRSYFLNDFYKDHLKTYQKRPIYWMFDSGKQNGFKALVYMHRWNADTVGNLRIEYLHKMQTVYEHEIETCQDMMDHSSGRDVAVASKRKEKLVKQLKECKDYDAKVAHIAFSKINIDLDDGVKVNYRKVQTGADGKFCEILADSKDIMAKEK